MAKSKVYYTDMHVNRRKKFTSKIRGFNEEGWF